MIQDDRISVKDQFINYLGEVPSYRFASKAVKRSEDTMLLWRKEDEDFSALCEAKVAEWVRKTLKKTKPEFQLERLMRDEFAPRQELTGKDGKDLPVPILGGNTIEFVKMGDSCHLSPASSTVIDP